MKIVKKKVCLWREKKKGWKHSVNMPFTKSLNRPKHTRHHFLKLNCCRQCRQTQFSLSTTRFEVKTAAVFVSFVFSDNECFVFGFIVFYLLVNSDLHWQTTHIRLFRISCLGLCPLWIDLKLSLSILARYMISGQSDLETELPLPDMG